MLRRRLLPNYAINKEYEILQKEMERGLKMSG